MNNKIDKMNLIRDEKMLIIEAIYNLLEENKAILKENVAKLNK
jgi:hypothetical protein